MQTVKLEDRLYDEARRCALEAGFSSVDEFVADVVSQSIDQPTENLDHLFTPELVAQLEKMAAEVDAGGKTFTPDEIRQHFEKQRDQWLKDHAS